MPTQYAAKTTTTKAATLDDLEKLLVKYGATSFIAGNHDGDATIAFEIRHIRFLMRIPLPKISEKRFTHSETGRARHADTVHKEHQTAIRATWRALLLYVKAKLVAIDQGLTSFEQEFLPYILLPSGDTVAQYALPAVREAYETGKVPPLLPGSSRRAIEG